MDYAVPTNMRFVINVKGPKNYKKPQRAKAIRKFVETHNLSIANDPTTGEIIMKVSAK